jgi:hypothetical protein
VVVADALAWPAEWVVDHRADVHAVMAVPALRAMDAVLDGDADPARRAKVKYRLMSFLNWGTRQLDDAERHGRAALDLFEAAGDPRSVLLTANELAWARALRGDYQGFELAAAEVVERARRAGERGVELQAIIAQSFGALFAGRLEAARALSEESHRLAQETGNVYRLPYTLAVRAWVAALEGRVNESGTLLTQAKALGFPYHDGLLVEWESFVHWLAGDFRAAAQSTLEVVAWNPEGLSLRRLLNLAPGVMSLVETGRIPEARRLSVGYRVATGGRPWYSVLESSYWLEGLLAWRDGDLPGATRALEHSAHRLVDTGVHYLACLVLTDLAQVAGQARAIEVAAEAAAQLDRSARVLDCDLYRALARIAAAWAHLAAGRSGEAAAAARGPVEALRPLGYRAFLARALDVLGRSLSGVDPDQAAEARTEAARIFDECGAAWRRDSVLGLPEPVDGKTS